MCQYRTPGGKPVKWSTAAVEPGATPFVRTPAYAALRASIRGNAGWTPTPILVILWTMTSIPLADAKAHLSEVISRVSKHHERVTVTVHGQPSAVLLAPDDLAMLEETIAVLADHDLMTQLATADADLAAGRVETQGDLEAAMRSRRTSA